MAAVLASVLAVLVVVLLVVAAAYALDADDQRRAADTARSQRDEAVTAAHTARHAVRVLHAELTTARHEAAVLRRHLTAQAALTPDATSDAGPELPALDLHTLRQVWACTPADFDTPGETR
ncbi:hypothetical protein [Micromonospora humida]|uniref:hypothetical protein n=1 Tax=Micromonospora humida TaxID=2809018 RepID=UPI003412EE3A